MISVRDFRLNLWECRGVRSLDAVVDLARIVRDVGLLPATGAWTRTGHPQPIQDLESFVAARHRDWTAQSPERDMDPLEPMHDWSFPLIRPETPHADAVMRVRLLHPDVWSVAIDVGADSHRRTGHSLAEFSEAWGDALERAGAALNERSAPVLAAITTSGDDYDDDVEDHADVRSAAPRRRLIVGWRTWFGPTYVRAFGTAWLLGLPDHAEALDGGGVFHRLAASATDMVIGDPEAYTAVQAYLRTHHVRAEWPPSPDPEPLPPTGRLVGIADYLDEDLAFFWQRVVELLGPTRVLEDGGRAKAVSLRWGLLSPRERDVAIALVEGEAVRELAANPRGRVHFRFDELPPDLEAALDALVRQYPRLSYASAEGDAEA